MATPATETGSVAFRGRIERCIVPPRDNGFTILLVTLDPPSRRALGLKERALVVKGSFPPAAADLSIRVAGSWEAHPQYGPQIKAEDIELCLDNARAVITFIASAGVEGVGEAMAQRIVSHLGAEALERIRANPECLAAVHGIGPKRAQAIAEGLLNAHESESNQRFLLSLGLSPLMARRAVKHFGARAQSVVRANPYALARVRGIPFETADGIGRQLGFPHDAPQRLQAGAMHLIESQLQASGDTRVGAKALMLRGAAELGVDVGVFRQALGALWRSGALVDAGEAGDKQLALERLYRDEEQIARGLLHLEGGLGDDSEVADTIERLIDSLTSSELGERERIRLNPEQREAIRTSLSHPVSIITGGPGTGKSTITRAIIAVFERLHGHAGGVVLAAPTGRAAQQIRETTGRNASTLHSLLRIDPNTGDRATDEAIEADLIIVDEVSMVDTELMARLAGALTSDQQLILIGDIDQLPSVGPGEVLADLIDSGHFACTRLRHIYRNAGAIKQAAAAFREGAVPVLDAGPEGNLGFAHHDPLAPENVLAAFAELRKAHGFRAEEIQVLSPTHKGDLGVRALNEALQRAVLGEPEASEPVVESRGRVFRVGDRVLQTANQLVDGVDKESTHRINNGDIGYVVDVRTGLRAVTVDFGAGREVSLVGDALLDLEHGYAITIHKAQGSQFPAVIMPVTRDHYYMLTRGRRLIYTGMTRAQRRLVWVGQPESVALAAQASAERRRETGLIDALAREARSARLVAARADGAARGVDLQCS